MSNIQVSSSTQLIEVDPQSQHISVEPATRVVTIVVPEVSSVSVTNAGPVGPPGTLGSFDMTPVIEEIDTRVATHNQATPIHINATSGRDFAALFQNGLI